MPGRNALLPARFQPITGYNPAEPQPQSLAHAVSFHADAFGHNADADSNAQPLTDADPNRDAYTNGNALARRNSKSDCHPDPARVVASECNAIANPGTSIDKNSA